MAIIQSDSIANREVLIRDTELTDDGVKAGYVKHFSGVATIPVTHAANDILNMIEVDFNAKFADLQFVLEVIDVEAIDPKTFGMSIGIAYGNNNGNATTVGQTINATLFKDGSVASYYFGNDAGTAVTFWYPVGLVVGSTLSDIDSTGQRLWELAGLSSNPGGTCYIIGKIITAATTPQAGRFALRIGVTY